MGALLGGHQSRQTVNATTSVVSNAVQNVTQTCITYVYGSNTFNISGDGNVVSGVNMKIGIRVDSTCTEEVTGKDTFQNVLQDKISQLLKDQEVAMTQWLDNSKDETKTNIKQSIENNITSNTVQTCVNKINMQNLFNISGNSNVVKNVLQEGTANVISKCMLTDDHVASTVNDVTNTINQHSEYESQNPFAFITDAIEAIMKNAMVVIAIIFIVVLCFIGLFMVLRRKKGGTAPPIVISTGQHAGVNTLNSMLAGV